VQTDGDHARTRAQESGAQGRYEARASHQSCDRKAFVRPAAGEKYQFVLESRTAVAFRRDPKPPDQADPPAQSGLAHDRPAGAVVIPKTFSLPNRSKVISREDHAKNWFVSAIFFQIAAV